MSALGLVLFPFRMIAKVAVVCVQLCLLAWFCYAAYKIRMYPIKEFGHIIHEFDPWFNYRAAEYLAKEGYSKFFTWYDYMSWYPLGRPIGTTIYPGMQFMSVWIWELMKFIPAFKYKVPEVIVGLNPHIKKLVSYVKAKNLLIPEIPKVVDYAPMSVNDICCLVPAWFGTVASIFVGLLTYEISRSTNAAIMATGIMAVIPAHLMRSVAGEYDNECIAMAVICSTFWLWLRSIRTPGSWPFSILAGLSYGYMVATWGGYIFVNNMIGIHALMLVGLGRFNSGAYKSYTILYVLGTGLAMQIPVVGWTPLRSLEQIGPLGVFLGYQVLGFCDFVRRKRQMGTWHFIKFRVVNIILLAITVAMVGAMLWPTGYFGPLSSRIRGLFVKHTKTGNPLVDSVAEHQPADQKTYDSHLGVTLDYVYYGAATCLLNRTSGCYFMVLYGFIAHHFSGKMARLVLICAPIVSIACGIWMGFLLDLVLDPIFLLLGKKGYNRKLPEVQKTNAANGEEKKKEDEKDKQNEEKGKAKASAKPQSDAANGKEKQNEAQNEKGKAKASAKPQSALPTSEVWLQEWEEEERPGGIAHIKRSVKGLAPRKIRSFYHQTRGFWDRNPLILILRIGAGMYLLWHLYTKKKVHTKIKKFWKNADMMAKQMAAQQAQVIFKVPDRQGGEMLIDDYLQGYRWIRDNTPKDARVMAWWDYGYQITGISERTSIADGNTWNHEHIATLGKMLTSPQKKAHNAIRHLADYVLVWAGGGGDDLAKSPHLARIGNSVFPNHCGDDDPGCSKFGFYSGVHDPTPMMKKSLLFNLVSDGQHGAKANRQLFQEVHTTKYGLMKVFKVMNVSEESKAWNADPANRICDAPGSWYCVGQYPPALDKLIAMRNSFSQLEDFNKKGDKSAYTKMIEKEQRSEM